MILIAPTRQPGCSPLSRGGAAPNSLFKGLEEQPGCVCFGSKMRLISAFTLNLLSATPGTIAALVALLPGTFFFVNNYGETFVYLTILNRVILNFSSVSSSLA